MLLVDQLSNEDKNLITDWCRMYGVSRREHNMFNRHAFDLPYVLRKWDQNKQDYLWKLFGEQLILEREVSYQRPNELLERELSTAMDDSTKGKMYDFKWDMLSRIENLFGYFTDEARAVRKLFDITGMRDNRYYGRTMHIEINGTRIDLIYNSSKPMKILNKMAKALDMCEEFEAFRIAHSQILNQKTLKGTLCLSIHPMDFMTLSDNGYGWDSCMNWEHDGCYRTGTVEMMNSSCMIVAYLRGSEPYRIEDHMWTGNKKWRELIVVHPKAIVDIKGYPYMNENLSNMAIEWVRELAAQNLGWDVSYDPVDYEDDGTFDYPDGRRYGYSFETNYMYNDFGTSSTCHRIIIPQGWQDDEKADRWHYINISGPNICMCCGREWEPCEGHEDMVLCWDCDPGPRCDSCNYPIEDDEYYNVEGDVLCPQCYEEEAGFCALQEDYFYNDHLVNIYLTAVDNDVRHPYHLKCIRVHTRYIEEGISEMTSRDFFDGNLREFHSFQQEDGEVLFYVNQSECTNYVLEDLFGLWSPWSRENYVSSYRSLM